MHWTGKLKNSSDIVLFNVYCGGLEANPHHLRGTPTLAQKDSPYLLMHSSHLESWIPGITTQWLSGKESARRSQEPQERRVWSLGQEDPLEEGMATHSSILAWRIPWTEEPGRLQSIGSQGRMQLIST